MMEYETLLKNAYEKVKPVETNIERFEAPKVQGMLEGSKTIITNFNQIASYLRRNPEHLLKFLSRELASSAIIEDSRLVLQRKMSSAKINEKIQLYIKEFVICQECKKPDTELLKEDRFLFVHCLACGAKHSVRAKIH
jgi:translation initiation factor 2 subunit 2